MDIIINSIVSNYLADYLEINPEKTKTSILSGTVELSGVKFKKTLFTTLNLPYLELEDGYIGNIKLKLSLPRFYLYPIIVNVDQIYIKVRPKNVNKISEKEILNTFEIYKQKKLKEFEELMNIKITSLFENDDKSKDNKKGSYSIVESIINNLHIDIEKIVVIFDDCLSSPKYPCTFGLTLNKLLIDSTSKDFKEAKTGEDDSSPFKYKKLSIVNLNLFLDKIENKDITKDEKTGDITANHKINEKYLNVLKDKEKEYLKDSLNFYLYCESEINDYCKDEKYHNYLLRQMNFDIKLILNEDFDGNKEPLMSAVMETSTIFTQLTNKQMKAITNNINYISLKDFYQQTTIDNYYRSKEKLDNKTINNYLENYSLYYKTKYIDIYKNEKENKKYLENMQKVEKNLTIDKIKALREMGNDIIHKIIEIGKIDKEIKNKEGSWSNYFSSKNSDDIEKLKKERQLKIEEQKKLKEKQSTINIFRSYISGIIQNNDELKNKDKKEDRVQFSFKFVMKELILIINEDKSNNIKKVFEMRYDLLQCEVFIKLISQYIKISLRDMEFNQYLSDNNEYQRILYSRIKKDNDNNNIINDKEMSLLLVEFEYNMLLPVSPFRFKVHFDKQIYIIIDYYYFYYLYNLFLKHISAIDLNNLTSMVNERISNIVKTGYKNLLETEEIKKNEDNDQKLFNINVDILLNAPILLLPLYFRDAQNTELMYVSLGQLKINSELAGEKDKNAIYDKYFVEFSNISVKILKQFNSQKNINDEEGEKLLYPSSFNIDLKNYIYQKQKPEHKSKKDFSPLIVNIKMNNTKFSLNENQILFMIKYLENLQRTQFGFEKEEEEANKKRLKKSNSKDQKENTEKKKEIKEEKVEIKEKLDDNNIINNKEEKLVEKKDNKKKEVINAIKVSIQIGIIQLFLEKNLVVEDIVDPNRKINFLLFFFRESAADFSMKTNGSMDMKISFGHFYLYDKDYKLDGQNNKISYINPEFKCIVGTTTFDIKDKKNNNIKFTEICDFKNDPNLKESIKILFTLDSESNTTTINIEMSKLTITPNFSTLYRLYIYLNKYLELYNDSMGKLKFERMIEKARNEEIKRIGTNDLSASSPIQLKIDDNIKEKQKDNKDKKDNNNKEIIKTKEHSIINIVFSMKGIDIYIPLDPNSHNTSIIFMTIETPLKYIMETAGIFEYSSSKVIKINYDKKSNELIAYINKGSFSIYDYKDDFILLNTINQICDNLDFSFLMNSKLDKNVKSNLYHIIFQMHHELNISLNINHVIVFLEFFDKINKFMEEFNKEENKVKLKRKNEIRDDFEIRRVRTEEIIENKKRKEEQIKLKRNETQTNTINYNEIITYEFLIENISVKFYDIIDGLYQSLFEYSMTKTTIELFQNSNPRDSSNLMNYLINSLKHERKELNAYDKNNFYLYFNLITNIEVKSLNNYLNQWESFVEPFSVKLYYCQFLKRMRPNMELFIPNMLNINLSLNFAKILSFTLKKFSMSKEEVQRNREGKIFKNEMIQDSQQYLCIETPILIIENYTGVDMEIWFDNIKYDNPNKDFIIKLKSNQRFELTKSILLNKYNVKKVNNNLNSTLSYKFCLDDDFIRNNNINNNNLIGHYFNINYHHIDIHDINDSVKISIESCSDNLLCRHIFFNSLISIRNDTKYKDIELCNNDNTQKIVLKDNKRQAVPMSWFLYNKNKNINLLLNNDSQVLIKNLSEINDINKYIQFSNGNVILIDVIRYKINLEEYYVNKNPQEKKDLFRVDIILSSPINLINNTPYEFYVNNNEKIQSTKSLNIYNNNFKLLSDYVKILNEKGKKKKNNEKSIIMNIIKEIKLGIMYNNKLLSATSFVEEKIENDNDDKNEEGKAINNFSSYNKTLSILLKGDDNKSYLVCRLLFNNPYEFISYNNKIYETMKVELNSFKYEIIFDYYYVNRTNIDLYLNNKIIDKVNSADSKNNILIPAKNYIPISKTLLDTKVKLRGNNNYWSDKFESSAIGQEFTLNVKSGKDLYNSLGIRIRLSNLFNKSFTYIIEDKYIVINDLPFDINIKENKLSTVMNIKSKENKVLLLNKESKDKKNNYKVGIDNCYSHIFDIDKLGSYDLLINYDRQVFEPKKIDIEDKLIELNNKQYYPVRCVINTYNKNIIYIIFSYSKQYINQLKNHTPQTIEILLNKDKHQKYIVKPEKTIPLIYIDSNGRYESFEKVKIVFNDKSSETVTLNEISTIFSGKNKDYIIKIQPDYNNSAKSIKIYCKNDFRIRDEKEKIKKYTQVIGSKIKIYLYGIGLSIINETPRETFYLSLYDIYLSYSYSNVINILDEMENYTSILFSLKNLQLDYCLDNAYDIIFNPSNQLLPPKPGEKDEKEKKFIDKVFEDEVDNTPFLQFIMAQKIKKNKNDNNKIDFIYSLYPEIAIFIQEFDVRINTILINSLINVVNEYMQIFLPSGDDNNELTRIKEDGENKINDVNLLIEELNDESMIKLKDKLLNKDGKTTNLVINNLTLSAIKFSTTFKVNKNAIEIRYVPELIITLINTLCSTLSSFSDVTLKLNEISFSNVFSDFDSLSGKLMNYYKNQILVQLYKIILNIDLLGNPVNLLEGLGTGIFQLFNEPRKGILKGPEEFGLGITRGARALVSNVVGGGFNTVSKITGTLLNATKNLSSMGTDEEIVIKEEEKPKGLLSGTLSGLKKGFGELTHGVAGIVTKPIEQTKKGGVGGFFKGIGSGLVGAVLAPVNTVLTVGNQVTSGISNSEFLSNKKRLRRFRLPRTLYKYLPISPYDEIKEIERKEQRDKVKGTKTIIVSLSNEKLYLENSTEIAMCPGLKDSKNMIFTNVMIKIVNNDCTKFIKKIYVCDVKEAKIKNDYIEVIMKDETSEIFKFKDEKNKDLFIKKINKYIK